MNDINYLINEFVTYGRTNHLVDAEDEIYTRNRLLELFHLDSYKRAATHVPFSPVHESHEFLRPVHEILNDLTDCAIDRGIITADTTAQRDLFDTKLMGLITPPPSTVRGKFREDYAVSPKKATDNFYTFCKINNYIRTDRIAKDEKWITDTEYGPIEITINLSKPEKDPRDIAKAGRAKSAGYPKCLLCAQNEGYAGHLSHPARQNLRLIPMQLAEEDYFLQYSPYVYYNEHCIVLNKKHIPMIVNRSTFTKLFDFLRQFPHYTIGSNADLPIVGGSILSHDHFQGGNYLFPMAKAPVEEEFTIPEFTGIRAGIVKWPMSVIRLSGEDPELLSEASDHILQKWRSYTDEAAYIFAETDETPHNTITPIVRMRDGVYEIDLVLRNNITTEEYPMGLYHPHNEYHHIKKENIGLIEVQGLAILPARLKKELAVLKENILEHRDLRADAMTTAHADWAESWLNAFREEEKNTADKKELAKWLDKRIKDEIGKYFVEILACAGVYKRTPEGKEAFRRFLQSL